MKRTDENVVKLAKEVVDSWDMDTLISMAVETLIINYHKDQSLFDEDVIYMDFEEATNG